MKTEKPYNFIEIQKWLKEHFLKISPKLTPKEREILSMRFGLENGAPHALESICKEFGVTVRQIRQIEAKVLRELQKLRKIPEGPKIRKPYTLQVYNYDAYKKRPHEYWKYGETKIYVYKYKDYEKRRQMRRGVYKCPSFEKFENFIWNLFKKGYIAGGINKDERFNLEPITGDERPVDIKFELWICNREEKKCYMLEKPVTDRERDFYNFLCAYFPFKRRLEKEEIEKLRRKKEKLTKLRNELTGKIKKELRKKRQRWLKELEKINKVIEKLPRKNSQES